MTQIQKFVFPLTNQETRIVDLEGNPWWLAKDVCEVLGLENVSQAISRLDEDEKSFIIINDGTPGTPNRAVINEPGLYSLILRSSKPEAKVAEQAPKVQAMLRLEGAEGSMCVTDAAKSLNMRPKALFSYLQAQKWIYKRPGTTAWIGYQDKIQAGLVEVTEYLQTKPDGSEVVRARAKITAKGLAKLASAFEAVSSN